MQSVKFSNCVYRELNQKIIYKVQDEIRKLHEEREKIEAIFKAIPENDWNQHPNFSAYQKLNRLKKWSQEWLQGDPKDLSEKIQQIYRAEGLAGLNYRNPEGLTFLVEIIGLSEEYLPALKTLIKLDVDVNIPLFTYPNIVTTALDSAAFANHEERIQLLCLNGAVTYSNHEKSLENIDRALEKLFQQHKLLLLFSLDRGPMLSELTVDAAKLITWKWINVTLLTSQNK